MKMGRENSNYRHGRTCEPQFCHCGNQRDFRAKECSRCGPTAKIVLPEDEIRLAISLSDSLSGTAKRLNVSRTYMTNWCRGKDVDLSHFRAAKNRSKPIESYFVVGIKRNNNTIKKVLIENGLIEYRCLWCGNGPEWNGKPLTIELDHINGNPLDNRIHNLRFLCPNCHSQTETNKGKNSRNVKKNRKVGD